MCVYVVNGGQGEMHHIFYTNIIIIMERMSSHPTRKNEKKKNSESEKKSVTAHFTSALFKNPSTSTAVVCTLNLPTDLFQFEFSP